MNEIVNLKNSSWESIDRELREDIEKQKASERKKALETYHAGELEADLDVIESNIEFLKRKADYILEIQSLPTELQRKFLEVANYINQSEYTKSQKLATLLTYAVTLIRLHTMHHLEFLTEEESVTLSIALNQMTVEPEKESYEFYGQILGEKVVLESIVAKSSNIDDRLDMIDGIVDYCDDFVFQDMPQLRRAKAIGDCVRLIGTYRFQPSDKVKS